MDKKNTFFPNFSPRGEKLQKSRRGAASDSAVWRIVLFRRLPQTLSTNKVRVVGRDLRRPERVAEHAVRVIRQKNAAFPLRWEARHNKKRTARPLRRAPSRVVNGKRTFLFRAPRPQAQRFSFDIASRSACSAVACAPCRTNTCREPTDCYSASHNRSSGTLAVSFGTFLIR